MCRLRWSVTCDGGEEPTDPEERTHATTPSHNAGSDERIPRASDAHGPAFPNFGARSLDAHVGRWACYRAFVSLRVIPIVLVLASLSRVGWAQPEPTPPASTAEALFDQGLTDMQATKFDRGCPALAESYRLEPLPGVLFTLSECENKWGKIATALSHYRDYVAQVKRMTAAKRQRQGERPGVAEAAITKLEADVPRLTITLHDALPDTSIVRRGDALVPSTQIGQAIPLDPGAHELTLEVPGEKPVTRSITLSVGEHSKVTLALPEREAPRADARPPGTMSTLRITAYVVGGVGITGVVVGVIAGAIAINRNEEAEDNCVDLVCNEVGISKVETVQEAGNTATVGFVIGAAGLAAGITLWLLSESDDTPSNSVFVTERGVGWRW